MLVSSVFRSIVVAAACAALSACGFVSGGGQSVGSTGAVSLVEDSSALPAPGQADYQMSSRTYHIGPYDQLVVDVYGIEEMTNREITADSSGSISFPLAGTIVAAGMTPTELASEIAGRLRANYVRDPKVTVNIKEATSKVVTVDGQVQQPGVYPVIGDMTLMRTIAAARGLDEFAQQKDVVVMRTVDGRRYAALYNLGAIRRGNYPDPQIFANDTVIVGESRQRRLFKDLLQVVPLLTTPIIIALQ